MSRTSNHSANMARHARNGAKQVKNSADHARNSIRHTAEKMGNEAVGAIRDGYENLRDTAGDYIDQGRSRVVSMEHNVEEQIKSRPLTAVLVSLGVGFLVGYIYSRR